MGLSTRRAFQSLHDYLLHLLIADFPRRSRPRLVIEPFQSCLQNRERHFPTIPNEQRSFFATVWCPTAPHRPIPLALAGPATAGSGPDEPAIAVWPFPRPSRSTAVWGVRFASKPPSRRTAPRISCRISGPADGGGTIRANTAGLASAVAASVAACRCSHSWLLRNLPAVRFAYRGAEVSARGLLLVGFAFFQSHRTKQCNCRPSKLSIAVLWLSAGIVALTIFSP